jgi:hypothetical protein
MKDLEVLKRLPGSVESLDEPTRQRIEALFETKRRAGQVRRWRVVKVGVLGVAAALAIAASAAAAIHWSDGQPVALPITSPSSGAAWSIQITDPNEPVTTTAELQAVVSEFAPAVRLPNEGSFDAWEHHVAGTLGTDDPAVFMRGDSAMTLVHVSECQWGQHWLDASAHGDVQAAVEALRVLNGIADWWATQGIVGHDSFIGLDGMRNGDSTGIQKFEDANCAWTGSWGATSALQGSKATRDLGSAIRAVAHYLQDGGAANGFDTGSAQRLAPNIFWTSSSEQPAPASPGAIFIALSPKDVVTLVSVSESGRQFCAALSGSAVVRGTTTNDLQVIDDGSGPHAVDPRPVSCVPGGW